MRVADRRPGTPEFEKRCTVASQEGDWLDFFLNHCSCGAVTVYQSLASLPNLQTESSSSFTSNGNSFKPESTLQSIERLESFRSQAGEGDDTDSGGSERCKMPMYTTTVNRNEIDMKHDSDGTNNLNALQARQKAEGQLSGKSRLKNRQQRESASMLKRSDPQLCRPEDGTCNSLEETNSVSALGLNRKSDWDHSR